MWNFEKPPLQKCFHAAHICWIHLCHNLCAAKKKNLCAAAMLRLPPSAAHGHTFACRVFLYKHSAVAFFSFHFSIFCALLWTDIFLPEVQFATPLDPTCLRLQNPKAVTTWFTSYAPCLSKKQAPPVNIFQIRFIPSAFPLSAEVCAQKWKISIIFSKNFNIALFGWLIKYQEYLHY